MNVEIVSVDDLPPDVPIHTGTGTASGQRMHVLSSNPSDCWCDPVVEDSPAVDHLTIRHREWPDAVWHKQNGGGDES